jgi:Putative bacterial sensory transduction regulator
MGLFEGIRLGDGARAEGEPPERFVERVTELCKAAGIKVRGVDEDGLAADFVFENDRSQQIVFTKAGELLGKTIVGISSPVAHLDDHPLTPDAAQAVLRVNGRLKLGSFAVSPEGDVLVVQQNMLLEDLVADELKTIVLTLVKVADDAERELTGGKDAF